MSVESNILGVPDNNRLEIVKMGITTINKPADSDGASVTVLHNLGYVPVVIAQYISGLGLASEDYIPIPHSEHTTAGLVSLDLQFNVSRTDIIFTVFTPDVPDSATYHLTSTHVMRYYLLGYSAS